MHEAQNTGTGAAHPFMIPLTKIDVERRLVIGTAAEEIPDKSKEIMDYATARPQFEAWSNEFKEATGGVSHGNLRVMHTKHVAGRLDGISYDDASKKVQIVAKVVDDNDWKKCLDGVYTGFSIGGGYLKKWKDPDNGLTRYTPIIREISLVDNPCMPSAKFAELVKADGLVEQLELKGVPRTFAELHKAAPATFEERWDARPQTFGELAKGLGTNGTGAQAPIVGLKAQFAANRAAARARAQRAMGLTRPPMPAAVPVLKSMPIGTLAKADKLPRGSRPGDYSSYSRSWSEDKHPRAEDGRFSGMTAGTKEYEARRATADKEDDKKLDERKGRGNVSWAAAGGSFGGYTLGTSAWGAADATRNLRDTMKYGVGEKGRRNKYAEYLRTSEDGDLHRIKIRQRAHTARMEVLNSYEGGGTAKAMAESARRKILQEHAERAGREGGAPDAAATTEAHRAADAFAEKIMAREAKNGNKKLVGDAFVDGKPTKWVDGRTAARAETAARNKMRGDVLSGKAMHERSAGRKAVGLGGIGRIYTGVVGSLAGSYLGQQSAYRIAHEEDGLEVTPGHHVLATAGDAVRAAGAIGLGHMAGGIAGSLGSVVAQSRFTRDGLKYADPFKAARAGKIGALVGAGLGAAYAAKSLVPEYRARFAGKKD